jgi:hypothetical protein
MIENPSPVPVDLETASGAVTTYPVVLFGDWRVVYDPLQWILQRRNGDRGRWDNRNYCVTKAGLLRCVREYCPKGIDISGVEGLPSWHPDRQ